MRVRISKENRMRIKQDFIIIPKEEYKRLKTIEKRIDFDLVRQFEDSLNDLKKGRFKRLA